MGFADHYLAKHSDTLVSVNTKPDNDLQIIVIIPSFDEPTPEVSLESVLRCTPPDCKTEVLILTNWPEDAPDKTKLRGARSFASVKKWIDLHKSPVVTFHPLLYPDMPAKYAGVGLARKTLMDEAVRRFNRIDNPSGIIVSLDADASCRDNYLKEVEVHFREHPSSDGCVIYFEHPLCGNEFPPAIYRAVCLYELHLRYYIQSIRSTGYKNAYHTVGSAFAVRASAYCRQGGMNKRKAGEDFYFLQKFFELGSFTELNTTCVYPSPRPSDRVPFGTGPVMKKFETGIMENLLTYNPELFNILKVFFNEIPGFFSGENTAPSYLLQNTPPCLTEFLEKENFYGKLQEIRANSASSGTFLKRFYRWFNMFRILKFLNSGKKYHEDIPVTRAASILLRKAGKLNTNEEDPYRLLELFRKWERNQ